MDLNFSFWDLFKYWDTLTQYINPLSILIWGIVGGLIGFSIMLIVQVILRKRILVRRCHWSLKGLSYVYMVFLPLFAGFCFTQWFALHNCQTQLVKNIPTYLGEANSAFNTYLKDEVEKVVEARYLEFTGREALTKTADLAGKTISDYIKTTETDLGAKVSAFLIETDFVKDKAVSLLAEKVGEQVMMDKEMTQEMLDVKIQNVLNDGVLNTFIEKHIRNILGGFKMNILMIFMLGLTIPLAEIILAHYLERRRLNTEAIQATIPPQPMDSSN